MNATLSTAPRETRPPEFVGALVGQELLRVAQDGKKQVSVLLAQWEMIIAFFKHGLEIPLCINENESRLKQQHRVILAGAIAMGELLHDQTKDLDVEKSGYSNDFVSSNLRYLHDTYRQWYVERDSEYVEAAFKKICDACTKTSPANP